MLRIFALIASLVFLSLPAYAGPGEYGYDMTKARHLVDLSCTDTNDTPATTVNVDVSNGANWDTIAEAINPDLNLEDAVQTSGSADGWCDATPWIIAGNIVTAGNEDLIVGPLIYPPTGVFMHNDYDTIGATNYGLEIIFMPIGAANQDVIYAHTGSTGLSATIRYYGPYTEASLALAGAESSPIISGVALYLKFDLNGAGTWTWDFSHYPARSINTNKN